MTTKPSNVVTGEFGKRPAPRPRLTSGLIDQKPPAKAVSSDMALGLFGCGLAVASASFGLYMNLHGPAPHEPGQDFSVFAQLAPRDGRTPPAAVKPSPGVSPEEPLDMTATASIPKRGGPQDPAMSSMVLEGSTADGGATITVDGVAMTVHVGDTIPGAGEVLAVYPGRRPLVKTSRGSIVAMRR